MEDEGSDFMAKKIVELEVECENLKDEKGNLETEVKWEREKKKEKSSKLKEIINSKERKWKEEIEKIREKYMKLEVQKRKLEIDLKASESKRVIVDDVVQCQQKSMQEKDNQIKSLLGKMEAEAKKQKLGEDKNLELSRRIQAMEKKMALEVEKQKHNKRNLSAKKAMEAEKRLREVQGMICDLVKRVEAIQKAEKAMQERVCKQKEMNNEIKKIVFEKMESDEKRKKEEIVFFGRIQALEAKVVEMREQKIDAEAEKTAFEEEKKNEAMVLSGKIESLEQDKREMESKIMEMEVEIERQRTDAQAYLTAFEQRKKELLVLFGKIESSEEDKRGMEGKITEMKAEIEKQKIDAEAKKIGFEKEKKEMEAKLSWLNRALKEKGEDMLRDCNDKDEVIKFLRKENETLEAQKRELQNEKVRLVIKRERD